MRIPFFCYETLSLAASHFQESFQAENLKECAVAPCQATAMLLQLSWDMRQLGKNFEALVQQAMTCCSTRHPDPFLSFSFLCFSFFW